MQTIWQGGEGGEEEEEGEERGFSLACRLAMRATSRVEVEEAPQREGDAA